MKKVVSKKFVAIFALVLVALALAAVAFAANVPGNLSGGGNFAGPNGVGRIDLNGGGVTDGQIGVYYNKNNDKSGNCDGDIGTINVKYGDGTIASYTHHLCPLLELHQHELRLHRHAHRSHRRHVRDRPGYQHQAARGDRIQAGSTTGATLAQDWVNLGYEGSGAKTLGYPFAEQPLLNGNWTLTPKPAGCRLTNP